MPQQENKVAPQTLDRFLELPNELIREVPELASGVSYKEETLIMSRLSRTSKRMRALFQPELDKRAAKQLLEHVLNGNFTEAQKMYAANPRILFIKTEGVEPAAGIEEYEGEAGNICTRAVHRKVIASPYQAALGAGDRQMREDMSRYFDKIIDETGNPIGHENAEAQREEWFPAGMYPENLYHFDALVTAITTDPVLTANPDYNSAIVKNPSEPTKKALTQFRNDFLPKEPITHGHLFNLNHLLEAFKVYNAHFEQWNWNQRSLFWCQVIGYLERLVPAVDAQAFCQGLYYLLEQKQPASRGLSFHNWVSSSDISYYPLGSSSVGLGFDFGIEFGGRGCRGEAAPRGRLAAGGRGLKNYVEQKHQILAALSNTTNSSLSKEKEKARGYVA